MTERLTAAKAYSIMISSRKSESDQFEAKWSGVVKAVVDYLLLKIEADANRGYGTLIVDKEQLWVKVVPNCDNGLVNYGQSVRKVQKVMAERVRLATYLSPYQVVLDSKKNPSLLSLFDVWIQLPSEVDYLLVKELKGLGFDTSDSDSGKSERYLLNIPVPDHYLAISWYKRVIGGVNHG